MRPGRNRICTWVCGLACVISASSVFAVERPPTLDPTYGVAPGMPSEAKAPQAWWIWADETSNQQTVLFRRRFELPRIPESASIFITADDSFELFINGNLAGISKPKTGDNPGWKRVHFVDIQKFLKAGDNVVAVRAFNVKDQAGLLARIDVEGRLLFSTDESWICSPSVAGERWTLAGYNDSKWSAVQVLSPEDSPPTDSAETLDGWPGFSAKTEDYMRHLPVAPEKIIAVHSGKAAIHGAESLLKPGEEQLDVDLSSGDPHDPPYIVIDFGKEIAGRIVLKSDQTALAFVETGESLEEALNTPWGKYHVVTTAEENSGTDFTAFRYAKVTFKKLGGQASRVRYRGIDADHLYYPVEYRGSFDCSDSRLTQIWYTGAYTSHLCMQNEIWDAPKRDRWAWMGDLHVSGEVINTVFADRFLMEKTLRKLREDAQGGSPPRALPKHHVNSIPGYSCAWIAALADFQRHVGDMEFLRSEKDHLLSLLDYLRGDLDERGVFANRHKQSVFADWSPGLSKDSLDTRRATHFFLIRAVQEAAFLFHELGDEVEAAKNSRWEGDLKLAAQKYLLDSGMGTFGDRRQVNAMGVLAGVATVEQKAAIYDKVIEPGSDAWKQVATPYYNYYILQAMSELGHASAGLEFVRDYWGGMLDLGATTFWEAYDPSWPKADFHSHLQADDEIGTKISLSHGWSSGPTAWLTETVLGVRPTSGGYKDVEIRPQLGDLKWVEGDVPTPHGILHLRVVRNGLAYQLYVSLPEGVHARYFLPVGSEVVGDESHSSL